MLSIRSLFVCVLVIISPVKATDFNDRCHYSCKEENQCESKQLDDTCYYIFHGENKAWEENRNFCKSQDMNMLKMKEEHEEDGFDLEDKFNDIWVGGRLKAFKKWTFVNNVSLDEIYGPHHSVMNGHDFHNQCGVVRYSKSCSSGLNIIVSKENCFSNHHFICRFGYWNKAYSFYISESSTNWFNARSRCKKFGGDLFYMKKGESIRILDQKLPSNRNQTLFIGMVHEMWQWEDGTDVLFLNWSDRKSNHSNKQCLMLKQTVWFEEDCEVKFPAVCEQASIQQGANEANTTETEGNKEGSKIWRVDLVSGICLAISVLMNVGAAIGLICCRPRTSRYQVTENAKYAKVSPPQGRPRNNRENAKYAEVSPPQGSNSGNVRDAFVETIPDMQGAEIILQKQCSQLGNENSDYLVARCHDDYIAMNYLKMENCGQNTTVTYQNV